MANHSGKINPLIGFKIKTIESWERLELSFLSSVYCNTAAFIVTPISVGKSKLKSCRYRVPSLWPRKVTGSVSLVEDWCTRWRHWRAAWWCATYSYHNTWIHCCVQFRYCRVVLRLAELKTLWIAVENANYQRCIGRRWKSVGCLQSVGQLLDLRIVQRSEKSHLGSLRINGDAVNK